MESRRSIHSSKVERGTSGRKRRKKSWKKVSPFVFIFFVNILHENRTKYKFPSLFSCEWGSSVWRDESKITMAWERGEWARGYKIAQHKHTHKYMMIIIVYALAGSAAAAPQNSANCCSSLLYNLPFAVSSSLSLSLCRPTTLIPLSWRHCFKFHRERENIFLSILSPQNAETIKNVS